MKPPKSLLIGEVNTNGINGRSKRKRGAFGEPVDDTFRNYMSRKIELQRRQFGQHVPPPPPPASPSLPSQSPPRPIASSGTQQYSSKNQSDDHLLHQRGRNRFKSNPKTHEKCDKSNITIPQFSSNSKPALQFSPHSSPLRATSVRADKKCGDRGEADSSGNEGLPSSSSAPLHFQGTNNSEDSALSLSQILIQLKRRHGNERTSFKQGSRGRKTPIKRKPTPEADNLAVPLKTSPHCRGIQNPHDSGGSFTPPDGCNSVLGILKNLERRHGDSSSFSYRKKLRKSSKSQVTFSPIIDKYSRSLEGNDGDFISTNRKKRKFSKSVLENLQSLQEREGDGNFSSDTATPCNSTFYSFDGKLAANKSPIIGVCTTWQSSPDQYSSRSQHGLNENGRLSDLLTDATQQFNDRALGETTLTGEGEQGMEESKLNIHPSSIRCQQQPQQPTKSPRAPKKLQTNHMSQNSLIPILPSQSTLSEQHNNFAQTTITAKSTSTSATNSCNRRSTHNITKLRPDLFFTGIIVLINGYTNPDGTTLLRLLQKHNGDVEKYETSRVTHIIAQQLSTAKVNIYKKQRKPIPVVKPDWIVESVKAGRLLDCREYLIDDVNENRHNTRSVKSFFGVENNLAMKKAAENLSDRGRDKPTSFKNLSDSDDVSLLNDSRSNDECMSATPAKESQDASNEYNGKTLHKINDTSNPSTLNGQVKAQTNSSLNINQTPYLLQASLSPKNDSKNESNRWNDKPPSKSHYHVTGQVRTVGNDPNFLESYFSNSRLSYIGSFKQRIKTNSVNSSTSHSKFGSKRFVLLVDMDCFFANVALRKFPQYRDKPVAVGHSSTDKSCPQEFASRSRNSSSELSTCNYIARKFGLRKGMFLGDAIQLCPDLVVLPYDFESFEEVSAVVAEVLHEYAGKYNGCVEVVSCDEAYIEIYVEPENYTGNDIYGFLYSIAEEIRKDIFKHTECTASVGVGQNKLLAKLGADRVKPNACCVVKDWRHFLDGLSLRKIPGVGYKFQKKLECRGITDVNNIWDLGDEAEKVVGEILGHGNARKIVKYCHGEDSRPVTPGPRKSIGAECNYGVRFNGPYGVDYMIMGLAKEVEKRMAAAGVRGSKMTLKVMQSKDATKMPGKFLGHGSCVSLSKSSDIPLTRNCDMIAKTGMKLFERLDIEKDLVRGMGIVICSLKTDTFEPATSYTTKLAEWLKRDEVMMKPGMDFSTDEPKATANKKLEGEQRKFNQPVSEGSNEDKAMNTLPSFSQLDGSILRELPRDILHEVKSTYRSVANNYKASERLQLTDSPLTNSGNVFDIPSLSQIDLDEVMELPPDICHAILEQIGKTNEGTNSAAVDTAISQKGPKRPTIRKVDRTIPIAGQVSVKRMMKLVNIKSGEESLPAFRLSQLDSLPLETQLQIVNDDDVAITKQVKKPSKSTEKSEVDLNEDSTVEDTFKKGIQHDQPKPTESFYVDNILPLKEFIISRPYPKSDDVKLVKDFLYLFVKKYQYDDTVAFLRAIKTMQNGWDESVYVKIRDEIVGNIFALSGNRLDVRRLRL